VAYAPYGESYVASGTTDLSYTGQNQDALAGHYDFLFREYNPVHGRWISPDPAGTAVVDPGNPQSLNRYAYVLNSPAVSVDPLGLDGCIREGHWVPPTVCPDGISGRLGGGGINPPPADWLGSSYGWWLACLGPNLFPSGCYGSGDTFGPPVSTGASAGGGGAANNGKTKSQCATAALKKNAVSLTLDGAGIAAGFLPGGGTVSIARNLVGWGTQTGLSLASSGVSFYTGNNTAGLVSWGRALLPTATLLAEQGSMTVAKAIPVLGTVVNAGQLIYDGFQTYQDYQACLGHP